MNKIYTENNVNIESNGSLKKEITLPFSENSLICPISFDIMTDPVIDREGNTYERLYITKWLRDKKPEISPKTKNILKEEWLVPNIALKNIIDEYIAIKNNSELKMPDNYKKIIDDMKTLQNDMKITIHKLIVENDKLKIDLHDSADRMKKLLHAYDKLEIEYYETCDTLEECKEDVSLITNKLQKLSELSKEFDDITKLSPQSECDVPFVIPYITTIDISRCKNINAYAIIKKMNIREKQEFKNIIENHVLEYCKKTFGFNNSVYLNYGSRSNLTYTYEDIKNTTFDEKTFESYVFFDGYTNKPLEHYGCNYICYHSRYYEITILRVPILENIVSDTVSIKFLKGYSQHIGKEKSYLSRPIYEIKTEYIDFNMKTVQFHKLYDMIEFIDNDKFIMRQMIPDNVLKVCEFKIKFNMINDYKKIVIDNS